MAADVITQNVCFLNALKVVQDELNAKIQTLSDLAVQCSQIEPSKADHIRSAVKSMQNNLEQFSSALSERSHLIRNLTKDSERNRKQADDYQQSSSDLRKWFDNSRQVPVGTLDASAYAKDFDEKVKKIYLICKIPIYCPCLMFDFIRVCC